MKNFETVYSAWDGDKLVGMICVMDDGVMDAYIHYLLVKPDYQLKGIGKKLISKVKQYYSDYINITIVVPGEVSKAFEYSEFKKANDKVPMYIKRTFYR